MIEDPELRSLFQAESEERIKHLMDELKLLENDPNNHQLLDEVFREAHSLKGAARMLKLHDIEKIVHILEDYFTLSKKGTLQLTKEVISIFLECLDFIADLVEEAVTGKASHHAMDAWINKLKIVFNSLSNPLDKPLQPTASTQGLLKELLIVNPTSQNVTFTAEKQEKILRNVQLFHEQANRENFATIRVNSQKIDSLSNQVSDLILIKDHMQPLLQQIEECANLWEESYNALIARKKLLKLNNSSDSSFQGDIREFEEKHLKKLGEKLSNLKDDLKKEINELNRSINAIGDSVRQLSMVHLSKLFDLFPRMVRDLARSGNKDIQLITRGGDLSVDKRIVELMKDPLMHLVRNCTDHGIETPDERIARGKPKEGLLSIAAKLTPKNIIFEVRDDGRGFDLAKIKQKVLENKMYSEAELEKINESEIRNLIFSPGFSTKEEISEISGRGIGLSVVRDAILKMNGLITTESEEGQYSLFRIKIPLELDHPFTCLKENLKPGIKKTILYVDDSVTAQHLVKRILENAGYQVVLARDGMEGLQKLNLENVDAIISDVEMPHMDGMILLRQMQMNDRWQKLPFIFLSNLSGKQLQEKCLAAGASAFFLKEDLNPQQLIKTLGSLVFP